MLNNDDGYKKKLIEASICINERLTTVQSEKEILTTEMKNNNIFAEQRFFFPHNLMKKLGSRWEFVPNPYCTKGTETHL
jgi:hypothetical protein